jgi:hypothetical protein
MIFWLIQLSGQLSLVSDGVTSLIAEKSAHSCLYCPEIPKNWRAHMGGHILRRLRNSGEREPKRKGRADAQVLAVTYLRVSIMQFVPESWRRTDIL